MYGKIPASARSGVKICGGNTTTFMLWQAAAAGDNACMYQRSNNNGMAYRICWHTAA